MERYSIRSAAAKGFLAASIACQALTPAPAKAQGETVYTVSRGDSLSRIAQRFYKDAAQWTVIYRANLDKIDDPEIVSIGTTLILPGVDDAGSDGGASLILSQAQAAAPAEALANNQDDETEERLRVNLVTGGEFAPFVDEDLPGQGMLAEVVRSAFQSIGYDVDVNFLSWNYGLDATRDGLFAGIFPYQRNEESVDEFLYSKPLYRVLIRLFVPIGSNLAYNRPNDLEGLTLCRPRGYALDDLQPLLDEGLIELKTPRSLETCFNNLVRAQVDAVSVNEVVGRAILHEIGLAKEVRALEKATSIATMHLLLPRYDADSETLIYEFDEALQAQKEIGIYKTITTRHLRQYYENLRTPINRTTSGSLERKSPVNPGKRDRQLSSSEDNAKIAAADRQAVLENPDDQDVGLYTPSSQQDGRLDNPAAGGVKDAEMAIEVPETNENEREVVFKLALSEPQPHATLLTYWTSEGSAKGGEDFEMDRGIIRLAAGETKATFKTTLIDDLELEDDEQFMVSVTTYPKIPGLERQDVNVVIQDDD